ncbi:uncharacterized protein FOMMEDRAFT_154854 [Fomitiporia mediterranea MF3/22]|uniref:uncharacterized protein n=1 Tax=Fomitiporia mediterranea (strain MF3/22) TaxID=694068 RepID=UPI00044091A5|nr:uncharacterized protein FOMMEDRAFT_154854 [Fomitiporia mediterranea MF3/22]EJD03749.1 hypothetical protein FOMMEDRAFT_154854 [Fomitiporia mediterranea MF3/22]
MSALARRPRLDVPCVQRVFSRGIRLPRRSVGDDVDKWLTGPGLEYKSPKHGPNWLGKKYPFPMNPSFKPPPPISNRTKEHMYERFMQDPERFNVRVLSAALGISLKRVDAILRLKGMEKSWLKGKELQTGFQAGMEQILRSEELIMGSVPESRKDVTFADSQDQDEADDHARDRYQRLFWEPVVEEEDLVVPRALEEAKEKARAARQEAREAKSDVTLLTGEKAKDGLAKLPLEKTVVVASAPGRPATIFKDVGGRFLDVEDRRRRMHESERRKEAKSKRKTRS